MRCARFKSISELDDLMIDIRGIAAYVRHNLVAYTA